MRRNSKVDIIKLIAACLVIFIHVCFPGVLGNVVNCIARFSVPFFFAISGYYAFQINTSTIRKRLKKSFLLCLFANLIYFLWGIFKSVVVNHSTVSAYLSGLTLKKLALWFFMGRSPFADLTWYLNAMIFVYLVFLVYTSLSKKQESVPNYNGLYIVSAAAFLFQIAFGLKLLGAELPSDYLVYRNGLFFGLPMFAMGLFLREHKTRIESLVPQKGKYLLAIVIGFLLSEFQWFGIGKVEMPLFMLLPVSCTILLLFMDSPKTLPVPKKEGFWNRYGILSRVSITIYIIHVLVREIYKTLLIDNPIFDSLINNEMRFPLLVMFSSILIGFIWCIPYSILKKAISSNK